MSILAVGTNRYSPSVGTGRNHPEPVSTRGIERKRSRSKPEVGEEQLRGQGLFDSVRVSVL
jgi:hypothetical protein